MRKLIFGIQPLWGKVLLCLLIIGSVSCGKEDKTYVPFEPELQEDYTETVFGMSLDMVYVKGGVFEMGATVEQEEDAYDDEKPVRKIRLDSYHIGKYEVTQAQWRAVMGSDPVVSYLYGEGDNYPAYFISWDMAQEFCKRLSEKTGEKYVLPTEAQWEYAARGGNKSKHFKYAGGDIMYEVAWYSENAATRTHPVGTKKPNELGIYDMSGNINEWCSDWYAEYDEKDNYNPQGPEEGTYRIRRGGCWFTDIKYCRVSFRNDFPRSKLLYFGFRVVRLP